MAGISEYERLLVEALLLLNQPRPPIEPGVGLFIAPAGRESDFVFDAAILPAMTKNGLNLAAVGKVFDDSSALSEVCRFVHVAEAIVADLTELSPSVMYVLGLAHGLGRCPVLITQQEDAVPFNLRASRCFAYRTSAQSLRELRDGLERALRIFLLASRATPG